MNNPDSSGVEIIHRKNRLKEKVIEAGQASPSSGFIDPASIKRAQQVIDNGQGIFMEELKKSLDALIILWSNHKKSGKNDPEKNEEIHRLSNHIKDMAATFGNELMNGFGQSLRDFSDCIDITQKVHITIVQAHIDVMMIAFTRDIRDIKTPEAIELKAVVEQAIQKYASSSP